MTIYKYTKPQYAESLICIGEMYFSSLAHFQAIEHVERGDRFEGNRDYQPLDGLDIDRQGQSIKMSPDWSFQAKAKGQHIFIYSTSLVRDARLAAALGGATVEIFDVPKFAARICTAMRRNPRIKRQTLRHDVITYYAPDQPAEEVWALPDKIVMHKHQTFAHQREYRFAFGTRADVWNFENADYALVKGMPAPTDASDCPGLLLTVNSSMSDCCRLVDLVPLAER